MDTLETSLTAVTMSSEMILPVASYVIASVLAVQTIRVSSERAPDKPGYKHPAAITAGMAMGCNQVGSWYAPRSTRSMAWPVAETNLCMVKWKFHT